MSEKDANLVPADCLIVELPDHLLIEIFIRVPMSNWRSLSCVNRHWANLFREECFWFAALMRSFPFAAQSRRWPGPIPRGSSKRRYEALCIRRNIFPPDEEIDEIVGHCYLFLKEQLKISETPLPSGELLRIIIDQFIACGKSQDIGYDLATEILLAVIDYLEETEENFLLLRRLALEVDVFAKYPYSRFDEVQRKVYERLYTDFRHRFNFEAQPR